MRKEVHLFIWLSCLILFFIVIFSFGVSFTRLYRYNKTHRDENYAVALAIYTDICPRITGDPKYGSPQLIQNCHEFRHLLEEDPGRFAFLDTLKELGFCWEEGCHIPILTQLAYPFQTFSWILLFILILLLYLIYAKHDAWEKIRENLVLPFFKPKHD